MLFAILVLSAASLARSHLDALRADDTCAQVDGGRDCAVHALQLGTASSIARRVPGLPNGPAEERSERRPQAALPKHRLALTTDRRALANSLLNVDADAIASYATRYLQAFSEGQAVFFHHISKSAGTNVCVCGFFSGCQPALPVRKTNCHARFDAPLWNGGYRQNNSMTCQQLAAYNEQHLYTLEGNENYLIPDGLCPQFWNIIVLRDPVERLISHLAMCLMFPTSGGDWCWRRHSGQAWPGRITAGWVFKAQPIISDNFYIRSLLGSEVYNLPFGSIGRDHLVRARQVLARFDVVYTLDGDLNRDLRLSLGWTCDPNAVLESSPFAKRWLATKLGSAGLMRLKRQNRFDSMLFAHARELANRDRSVFEHHAFQSVVDRDMAQCLHGHACGYLCRYPNGSRV